MTSPFPQDEAVHAGFGRDNLSESLLLSARHSKNLQKLLSSTPNAAMETSFGRCFREVTFGMDNDSGYVSTNQESNLEYSSQGNVIFGAMEERQVYLSEDALLERPEISTQGESCPSSSSVVPASLESQKTTFSGFDDDESGLEKDISKESFIIPLQNDLSVIQTPEKSYTNPMKSDVSPDLFSDEEELETSSILETNQSVFEEKYMHPNDQKLIKRVQLGLSGVYPPPSVTIVSMTVVEMLEKIKENGCLFTEPLKSEKVESNSLLVTEISEEDLNGKWPEVMKQRYHGLYYNRSKLSEEFEHLCTKYAQRYVGAETQSTCTVFDANPSSPSKRKSAKLRWTARSPGRRLSHLARRRITFNNPVLQSTGSNVLCSRARQILVDARRLELLSRKKSPRKRVSPRKSPRKTPRKSPRVKGRTPSSSAKKRLALQFRMYSEVEEEKPSMLGNWRASGTKRALFRSPDRNSGAGPSALTFSSFSKKTTPKRALFTSPNKNSPTKLASIFDRKRKRPDDEENPHPSSKLARSLSLDVQACSSKPPLQRRPSECSATSSSSSKSCELSAHHKKKLQWAVYEALKAKEVGVVHPQFKVFASVLARVTRRFLPNLAANVPRPEGGTSEKMLRIARQHVHAVVNGKSVDEIVQEVEAKSRVRRPVGYVGLGDKENVLCEENQKYPNKDSGKPAHPRVESKIDRIRKVIDFGDDTETAGVLR